MTPFQAIGLAVAGYTLWVLADSTLKMIGASSLPAYEVVALVGGAEVVWLLSGHGALRLTQSWRVKDGRGAKASQESWRAARDRSPALWPRDPVRQLLRSCLDLMNNICVVIALRHVPLALFYILVFLAPMVTALLAALVLREPLGWKRGLAILTGFCGVLVAVNPLGARRSGDWTGYTACLVCVACFSMSMVWSRILTQTESAESLTFFSGLVMAGGGSVGLLWRAQPVTALQALALGCCALFSVIGSLCFFVALKHTSAANVSQYHYSQLITGALIAFLIWRERITLAMLLGAALIVVAGAYTAATAYTSRKQTASIALTTPND